MSAAGDPVANGPRTDPPGSGPASIADVPAAHPEADAPHRDLPRLQLPDAHVLLPGGSRRVVARYAVVPLSRLLTSHVPIGRELRAREGYPQRVQFREYAKDRGASAAEAVYAGARRIDPEQLLDPTRTTVTGPPVVAPWPDEHSPTLVCLVGNHRVLLFLVARELNSGAALSGIRAYVNRLRDEVATFGVAPDAVARILDDGDIPILVRVARRWERPDVDGSPVTFPTEPVARAAAFGRINRASDGSFTKARDVVSLAHSIAADIRALEAERNHYPAPLGAPTPLQHVRRTLKNRSSSRYLTSPDGMQFFRLLLQHGVVPGEEQAAYLIAESGRPSDEEQGGRLNRMGRVVLEAAFSALVFDDAAIHDTVPPSILHQVHAASAALLELAPEPAGATNGAWDLSGDLASALRLVGRYLTEKEATSIRATGPFVTWLQQGVLGAADPRGGERASGWANAAVERSKRDPKVVALALFVVEHGGDIAGHVREWRATAHAAGSGVGRGSDLFGAAHDEPAEGRGVGRPRREVVAPTLTPDEASSPARAFRALFWPRRPEVVRWLDTLERTALEARHSGVSEAAEAEAERPGAAPRTSARDDVDPHCDPRVIFAAARRAWRDEWQRLGRAPSVDTRDAPAARADPPRGRRVCKPLRRSTALRAAGMKADGEDADGHGPVDPAYTASGMAPPTARHTFADDEVFATCVLAEALGCPIAEVAGTRDVVGRPFPPRPTARTCRRRMTTFWTDPHVGPFLRERLGEIGAHRDARRHKTVLPHAPEVRARHTDEPESVSGADA